MSHLQAEQPKIREELALLLGAVVSAGCGILAKHHTACQGVLHTPPKCIKVIALTQ